MTVLKYHNVEKHYDTAFNVAYSIQNKESKASINTDGKLIRLLIIKRNKDGRFKI